MKSAITLCFVVAGLGTLAAQSSGGPYSVSAASLDSAGGRTTGGVYRDDSALGATSAAPATGGTYAMAGGYSSMLRDAIGLAVLPALLAEDSVTPLTLHQVLDDGTQSPAAHAGAVWNVLDGPLSISTTGVATAQTVPADTQASLQVTLGALTSAASITVRDTIPDNFGTYGSDGIGDDWQVRHFGVNNPLAGATVDADGDGQDNLFEFTAGLEPTSSTSRFTFSLEDVPNVPGQKRMVFQPAANGRTFSLMKTLELFPADWQPVPGAITAGNGGTAALTDPDAAGQRAFYKVQITVP